MRTKQSSFFVGTTYTVVSLENKWYIIATDGKQKETYSFPCKFDADRYFDSLV
jgi:hypothetical protein